MIIGCPPLVHLSLSLRMYFGEHNVKAMLSILEPLHHRMERGPETLKEISFNHVRHNVTLSFFTEKNFICKNLHDKKILRIPQNFFPHMICTAKKCILLLFHNISGNKLAKVY